MPRSRVVVLVLPLVFAALLVGALAAWWVLRAQSGAELVAAPSRAAASAVIDDALDEVSVPGVQVAVDDGVTRWTRSWGVEDDTVFQVGSLSKPVAAAAVVRLAQAGQVDLDAPVSELLTSWSLPPGTPDPHAITLRRLLSHTAGINVAGYLGHEPGDLLPTTAQALDENTTTADGDRLSQDGEVGSFRYSGGGFTLAQQVVEDVTGEPFAQVVAEQVLTPLAMTHSGYACTTTDAPAAEETTGHDLAGASLPRYRFAEQAAAGLCSTASDLIRFAAWLGSDDPAATEMRRPVSDAYGLGLHVDHVGDEVVVGHDGNNRGWVSDLRVNPRTGVSMVLVTNGDAGNEIVRAVAAASP